MTVHAQAVDHQLPDTELRSLPADAWMQAMRARVEAHLDRVMPASDVAPRRLHEAMRYATLGGGKRVRAMLVYAAGDWSQAEPSRLDAAAAAVELIHAYSLVHDDMPCMDDDDLRRGRPTVHVAFDEATALLVGDALQSLAFEVLASTGDAGAIALLADASGSRGMAGGQAIDLASVGKALAWPELEAMHRAKTGALLRASVLLGTSGARSLRESLTALERYATAIGLAFQVVDDILDVETDSATLGKTAGKDAMNDKPTVVSVLGMNEAKALASRLRQTADGALDAIGDAAGNDPGRLRELASFIIGRGY